MAAKPLPVTNIYCSKRLQRDGSPMRDSHLARQVRRSLARVIKNRLLECRCSDGWSWLGAQLPSLLGDKTRHSTGERKMLRVHLHRPPTPARCHACPSASSGVPSQQWIRKRARSCCLCSRVFQRLLALTGTRACMLQPLASAVSPSCRIAFFTHSSPPAALTQMKAGWCSTWWLMTRRQAGCSVLCRCT